MPLKSILIKAAVSLTAMIGSDKIVSKIKSYSKRREANNSIINDETDEQEEHEANAVKGTEIRNHYHSRNIYRRRSRLEKSSDDGSSDSKKDESIVRSSSKFWSILEKGKLGSGIIINIIVILTIVIVIYLETSGYKLK